MSSQWVWGNYNSGTEVNGAPIILFNDFAHVAIIPSYITCGCGWWTRQEVSENADLRVGSIRIFIVWGQTGNVGIVWRKQQQGPALEHGNELVPSHSPVASDHCWTISSILASWEYTSQSWQAILVYGKALWMFTQQSAMHFSGGIPESAWQYSLNIWRPGVYTVLRCL